MNRDHSIPYHPDLIEDYIRQYELVYGAQPWQSLLVLRKAAKEMDKDVLLTETIRLAAMAKDI